MALTALRIAKAKPGTYCDGKGLLLRVTPTGAKSWMLRIQHNGRRRDFGLGSTDWVTLAEARAAAAAEEAVKIAAALSEADKQAAEELAAIEKRKAKHK